MCCAYTCRDKAGCTDPYLKECQRGAPWGRKRSDKRQQLSSIGENTYLANLPKRVFGNRQLGFEKFVALSKRVFNNRIIDAKRNRNECCKKDSLSENNIGCELKVWRNCYSECYNKHN